MATLKRASLGVVIGAVVLGILLTLGSHFSPKFLNKPILKKEIQAGFSKYFNTQVDYNTIKISFFPHPHLEIYQGAMSIGKQTSSKFISAAIYPKLLPLLMGKFQFSKVDIDSPETKIVLAEESALQSQAPTEAIINVWRQLSPLLSYLAGSEVDDISLKATNARMDLYKGDRLLLSMWDLDWRMKTPGEDLIYNFSCRSNVWRRFSNKGVIHRQKKMTEGEIKIDGLRLQPVQAQFFSNSKIKLDEAPIDVVLAYVTDGRKTFNAGIKSSFSSLTLSRGEERFTLSGHDFDAGLSIDGRKIDMSISSLKLDSPQIDLAARFSLNPLASHALLEIKGKNTDVASVRKAVLFFAGHIPAVDETFQVIRAGRVPEFVIRTQASQIEDLDDLQNIRITGHMVDGNIYIPKIEFDLTQVNGQALISKGILEGTNLSARFGNSAGKEGRMTIDLDNHKGPFRLDILVDADVSQVPPVLSRLIDHKAFQRELKRIQNVTGRAQGRLVLEDSLSSVHPRIDVSKFTVAGDYQRIPFPLSVAGERLTLADARLTASGLSVRSKGGKLSGVDGSVDWGKVPEINATVGKSTLDMEVVFPWIRSMAVFRKRLTPISHVKGTADIASAQVKGNYLRPERITFTAKGRAKGLVADVAAIGDKMYFDQGDFSINRKTVLFSEAKIRFLDASLNASGKIDGFIKADPVRSIDLAGVLGIRALQWASALVRLPSEFTIRPPLWISSARLSTGGGKPISFSGKLAVQKGPSVDIEVSDGSQGFMINHLRISDDVSNAVLTLRMKYSVCDLSFKGRIEKSTLDAVLTNNRVVTGWVEGDIQAWIRLDNPIQSTAIGKLTGEGFMVFLPVTSLKVNHLSLEAVSDHLKIDTAQILWIDEQIDLSGDLTVIGKSVKIDLDVSMDHFDWNKYGNLITGRKARESGKTDIGKNVSFLEGTIRFSSHHLRYGTYTWRPFKADLTFRPNYFMIDVHKANLCGVSMPGMVTVRPDAIDLTIGTVAKGESLDDALYCLGKQAYVIEGRFDLEGYASVKGDKRAKIVPEMKGEWTFSARDGHIDRLTVLSRIFELLNVAEIFKLKLPDLKTEGFDYKKIDITWRLDGGKVIIDAGHLDSAAMEIAFKGELDLIRDQADVLVLVAPLQTLNLIVKNIPIVRHILAGTFISIPFRVEGDLQNPEVSAMNPSDVGSEMLNLMKRTADVPMQMIQPLTNFVKNGEKQPAP